MIYNFNLGIGWASSGVEYAQAYRSHIFRKIGVPAKFIFTDFFSNENIEHFTKNMGFLDEEIIWLYQFFTDFKIAPVTYSLDDFKATISNTNYKYERKKKIGKIIFDEFNFYTLHFINESSNYIHRVEYVSKGLLIRKDFFTYGRLFTEYYAPKDNKAHLYLRRFYNENGTIAYDEITDNNENAVYKFKDRMLYSKEELLSYMISKLNINENDTVIIDRTTLIGRSILENTKKAKVCVVIHADHFNEQNTNDNYILWNNFYEYPFSMYKHIDYYISSTGAQSKLLKEQFNKYMNTDINAITIPVGSIDELKYPTNNRKPFSIITASRLAKEKHIDWIIRAVAEVKKYIPEISLDIYGKGREEENLLKIIKELKVEEYVKLCGHHDLSNVYQNYELYLSGSTSEGFGLSLLEAVGSGLPIVGFDVRYGNPTFIDDDKNGYLIHIDEHTTEKDKIDALKDRIIRIFNDADLNSFHERSYEIAKEYLTKEVEEKWKKIVE